MWIELWKHEWNKKYQYTETNLKYRGNEKYDEIIRFLSNFEPIISPIIKYLSIKSHSLFLI